MVPYSLFVHKFMKFITSTKNYYFNYKYRGRVCNLWSQSPNFIKLAGHTAIIIKFLFKWTQAKIYTSNLFGILSYTVTPSPPPFTVLSCLCLFCYKLIQRFRVFFFSLFSLFFSSHSILYLLSFFFFLLWAVSYHMLR